jgi:maltooligosyltrehalose trehalohydrolase
VHGASVVVDPASYVWHDANWSRPAYRDLVIYELHIGTFTPEGTYLAAIEKLGYLKRLGVRAIEIMPIGDFPGERNWGYDGVMIYAPTRAYGEPNDLRALVDAAHQHGIAVILDVVYNHFGPDGNYLGATAKPFSMKRIRRLGAQASTSTGRTQEPCAAFSRTIQSTGWRTSTSTGSALMRPTRSLTLRRVISSSR